MVKCDLYGFRFSNGFSQRRLHIAQIAEYFCDYGRTLEILRNPFCHQQFADTMSAKGTTEPWMANLRRLHKAFIPFTGNPIE